MIDRFSATRKERCEIDDGWELLREATSLLPEITAKERERLITRATASRVLPAAVRLKARLDSFLGRNPDPENITLEAILESMAEILLIETDRKVASKWSDFALVESYKSERIKLISNQIPQRESA